LISKFKEIKAKDLNLKVKLSDFKDGYNIKYSEGYQNAITIEQVYNPLKRKIGKIVIEKNN